MGWTWVNDLLSGKKKDFSYDARCPYAMCPSNQPYWGVHKPRLKFIQRIAPMVYQYRCRDCGCIHNQGVEVPDDRGYDHIKSINPHLLGDRYV